jgi:hypothetical protein
VESKIAENVTLPSRRNSKTQSPGGESVRCHLPTTNSWVGDSSVRGSFREFTFDFEEFVRDSPRFAFDLTPEHESEKNNAHQTRLKETAFAYPRGKNANNRDTRKGIL